MRKIDRIYVAGYKHDLRFTRACVASIRTFYPEIRITLIKDRFYGDYSTRDVESCWNCGVLDVGNRVFGWGFSKLEPLFLPDERFLVLDSDILFVGPVLQRLEAFDADFVLQDEPDPSPEFIQSHYFDLTALQALDPEYAFPGFTSNTGQWVGTGGVIQRADLELLVEFENPPRVRRPDIFKLGEQGMLNYLLTTGAASKRWSLARDRFMEVGTNPELDRIHPSELKRSSVAHPFLIHWCGCRDRNFRKMHRGDLWTHFEKVFYSRQKGGSLRRLVDLSRNELEHRFRSLGRSLVRRAS